MVKLLPKMVISDVDGTFVNYSAQCSEDSQKAAIKLKEKGIKLVLATGRALTSMVFIKNISIFDYLIGGSGAFIYDIKKEKIIFKNFIKKTSAIQLIDLITENGLEWSTECDKMVVFSKTVNKKRPFFIKMQNSGYEIQFTDNINYDIPRLLVNSNTESVDYVYEKLKSILDMKKYKVYRSFTVCEVSKINVTKWTATKILLDHLNINKEDIIALGDSANDYELLKNAGFSIAMGNSLKKIKDISDFVTKDVCNAGWYYAFKKLGVIND